MAPCLLTALRFNTNHFKIAFISEGFIQGESKVSAEDIGKHFPALPINALEFIYQQLILGKSIKTYWLIGDGSFDKVSIEGNVINQEASDLLNIMISSDSNFNSEDAWIYDHETKSIIPSIDFNGTINSTEELLRHLQVLSAEIDQEDLHGFLEDESNKPLDYTQITITKAPICSVSNQYSLIQLSHAEFISIDKDAVSLDLTIKERPFALFLEQREASNHFRAYGNISALLGPSEEPIHILSQKDWENYILPEDLENLYFQEGPFEAVNAPVFSYYRLKHPEKGFVYVQETTRIFEDQGSSKKLAVKIIEDISDIDELSSNITAENDQHIPGQIPCMVYLFEQKPDGNQKIVFANEGANELLGIRPDYLMSGQKALMDFIHPDDLPKVIEQNRQVSTHQDNSAQYFRIISLEGQIKSIFSTSSKFNPSEKNKMRVGYLMDITYHREVEVRNKKHLEQFQSIFDNSPLAIMNFDQNGVIQSINKTLLKKLNIDDSNLIIGKNIRDFATNGDIDQAFFDAFKVGEGHYEGPYVSTLDNSHFYVRLTVEKMEYEQGYQAFFEDLSQKEYTQLIMNDVAEISARYSDKEFFNETVKLITRKLGMSFSLIGEYYPETNCVQSLALAETGKLVPNIKYSLANTPCESSLLGDDKITIYDDHVCDFFPLDLMLQEMNIQSYCSTGIHDKNGEKIGILLIMDTKPLSNRTGIKNILTVLGDRIGADLQRIRNEQKLLESKQLYQSVAENFPKGTVDVLDREFRYIYTEGNEYKKLKIDPQKLIGSYHLEKYDEVTAAYAKSQLDEVLMGKTVIYEVNLNDQIYKKTGVPLKNENNEVFRILLVTQNITESKKFEIERERLIKDLSNHNDELQRFAYIVSHNLRAPIVNITSLLDLYDEEHPDSPDNIEVIENLKLTVSILNSTLTDLIEVVSFRKQKILKVEEIYLNDLINNLEKSIFKQLKESKVIIHKDFKAEKVNYIHSHIENILMNFMTNSIKYSHPDRSPEIWITSSMINDQFVLTFRDNGIGIDLEKYKDRIFGLYQRFHSHIEGKGLGLYLVREQIRSLEGEIHLESELGKGTCFKVTLKNLILTDKQISVTESP
ncbi:PAS domain-containing protein [Echinicola marina]|uniref:ATP-binding protein n=1 Tax=Echinicola marina TaxID=2859768 RepID=UPI001CF6ADE3|nr:ATP-binding protein [Echinicola marina]UCS94669.1 PAS domain-containing protein [Echinicola marina]